MTSPFPHHYQVALEGDVDRGLMSAPEHPAIAGGAPAQFGGRSDWWSPEELLLASVCLCQMPR